LATVQKPHIYYTHIQQLEDNAQVTPLYSYVGSVQSKQKSCKSRPLPCGNCILSPLLLLETQHTAIMQQKKVLHFHWMLQLFGLSTHYKMMYGTYSVNKETYNFMKMPSVMTPVSTAACSAAEQFGVSKFSRKSVFLSSSVLFSKIFSHEQN
jgi:hypothetical protein